MADGDPLPRNDHVTRYCSPRDIADDGWISSAVFKPRDNDNGCASVTHVECFGLSTYQENVTAAMQMLVDTVVGYQEAGKVAILVVWDIQRVATSRYRVNVIKKSSRKNPCHSVVTGLADMLAVENLASVVNRSDVRSAKL
jgi:hypothetical protein